MLKSFITCFIILTFSNLHAQFNFGDLLKKLPQSSKPSPSTSQPKTQNPEQTQTNPQPKQTPQNNTVGTITDMLGGLLNSTGGGIASMTNDRAALGLKEALNVGTNLASSNLSVTDGFFGNEIVKILLPKEARQVESVLRKVGMGKLADDAILSLNRAAEAAAGEAKPIFTAAITQMTIPDAINILTGGQNAATEYLKKTSGVALQEKFKPIIDQKLSATNATKYWSTMMSAYNKLPLTSKVNTDISGYVTERATEGIFRMVADQEKQIRENPIGRGTQILQDVFGWADKNKK
ncbi:MAG: DUF4197 domain-containing protein [Chitinophagales bacterium]|jgi:hypothetical protein|nr:DUF4197 domain-containing protein [Chitinophagales bacterium]